MDLSTMTNEQLQAMHEDLRQKKLALKEEARAVQRELEQRAVEKQVEEKYDKMSDREKAALAQVVKVKGIPSQEGHGTPEAQ